MNSAHSILCLEPLVIQDLILFRVSDFDIRVSCRIHRFMGNGPVASCSSRFLIHKVSFISPTLLTALEEFIFLLSRLHYPLALWTSQMDWRIAVTILALEIVTPAQVARPASVL